MADRWRGLRVSRLPIHRLTDSPLDHAVWRRGSPAQQGADAGPHRDADADPDRQPHGEIAIRHTHANSEQNARHKPTGDTHR